MSSSLPRKSYARIPVNIKLPNLIEVQLDSFERLKRDGLGDLFHEVSPIESYNKGMKLYFPSRGPESKQWGLKYWFDEPKHNIEECFDRRLALLPNWSGLNQETRPLFAPGCYWTGQYRKMSGLGQQ